MGVESIREEQREEGAADGGQRNGAERRKWQEVSPLEVQLLLDSMLINGKEGDFHRKSPLSSGKCEPAAS